MNEYEQSTIILQSVTLGILLLTLVVFWLQFNKTRQEFNIRMRPYLGIDDIKIIEIKDVSKLELEVYVKNFGSLPATDAKLYGEFYAGEEEKASFKCETKGAVFPSEKSSEKWIAGATDIDKEAILTGKKPLKLVLNIDYCGPNKTKYETKTSRWYDYQRHGWQKVECNLV